MRFIIAFLAVVIFGCALAISYDHTLSLMLAAGLTGVFAHLGVVAFELSFALGTLALVFDAASRWSAISAIALGLGIIAAANVMAGLDYGMTGVLVGLAIPTAVVVAEVLLKGALARRPSREETRHATGPGTARHALPLRICGGRAVPVEALFARAGERRTCSACGVVKPLLDFPVDRRRPDGSVRRKLHCKPCHAFRVRGNSHKLRAVERGLPADDSTAYEWVAHMEERDQWACHLCAGAFTGNDTIQWDHLDPLHGGEGTGSVLHNMAWAHAACNSARGTTPLNEWARHAGLPWSGGDEAATLVAGHATPTGPPPSLEGRRATVAQLRADGMTVEQIARHIGVSIRTVHRDLAQTT